MNKLSLLAVAMLIAADAYAGSCVVCPFGMKCTGGTAAPVDNATELQAAKTKLGIPALIPTLPDGVYASNGWYLQAADPKDQYLSKHIKIKAGTTFVVNGKAITFTADTNKSLTIATAGYDYDICVSNAIDLGTTAGDEITNSPGVKTVAHNTTCGAGWLKIGGFHTMPCTDSQTATLAAAHPYYKVKEKAIMPNSVWTLKHHPVSIEGGFVYDPAMGHWVMIYLATLVSNPSYYQDTLANSFIPISSTRYNPTLCRGQTGYCDGAIYPGTYVQTNDTTTDTYATDINNATKLVSRYNQRVATGMEYREMFDLLAGGGAKPLSDAQFSSTASGSIERNSINSQKYTTGCYTFGDRLNISNIGALSMTGEYPQDLDYAVGPSNSLVTQSGIKGNSIGPTSRVIAGGNWADILNAGSRSRYANNTIFNRGNDIAARGASPDAWR